jgi:hypothetical protein
MYHLPFEPRDRRLLHFVGLEPGHHAPVFKLCGHDPTRTGNLGFRDPCSFQLSYAAGAGQAFSF